LRLVVVIWRNRRLEPEREHEIISKYGQHAVVHALGSKRAARAFLEGLDVGRTEAEDGGRASGFPFIRFPRAVGTLSIPRPSLIGHLSTRLRHARWRSVLSPGKYVGWHAGSNVYGGRYEGSSYEGDRAGHVRRSRRAEP
jgi:hypothetical protein